MICKEKHYSIEIQKEMERREKTSKQRCEPKIIFKKNGGNNHWKSQHRSGYQVKQD